jgi:hypothetical protein
MSCHHKIFSDTTFRLQCRTASALKSAFDNFADRKGWCRGNTLHFYSGDAGIESSLEQRPSRQILKLYLGHDRFAQNNFQFITHQ